MPTQRILRLPVPTPQFGQEILYQDLRWLYASTREVLEEREQQAASMTETIRRRVPLRADALTEAAQMVQAPAMLIP